MQGRNSHDGVSALAFCGQAVQDALQAIARRPELAVGRVVVAQGDERNNERQYQARRRDRDHLSAARLAGRPRQEPQCECRNRHESEQYQDQVPLHAPRLQPGQVGLIWSPRQKLPHLSPYR